jgi:hypothetical protein
MTQEVYAIVSKCVEGKGSDDLVFTREDGRPIGDFRKTWHKMCCNAGLGRMACRKCDLTVTGDKSECGCEKLHYVGLLVHNPRRIWMQEPAAFGCSREDDHENRRMEDKIGLRQVQYR